MNRNLSLLVILIAFISYAQERTYDYASIPDSLKEHANAVIRYEKTDVVIAHQSKMSVAKEKVVTILNKKGDYHGYVRLHYDDQTSVKDAEIRILDKYGNLVDKIKKSDFEDVSAVPNGTLYSDSRYLYYDPASNNYPYTVVIHWEVTTSDTAFINYWMPLSWYYVSTEHSSYSLTYPSDMEIRHKAYKTEGYQIEEQHTAESLHYELNNAKAVESEPLSPDYTKVLPSIFFSADQFSLGNEKGKASNLNEFGQWWYDHLLTETSDLSDQSKQKVRSMVEGMDDPRQKAKKIYEYVQDNSRYISVQVGIGGWKPMKASEVDRLGYGDCKALTNYTMAMLDAAGVPSYYAKIYAGRGERKAVDPELTYMMSNHVILMVPFPKDTVWLECTSQKVPFGHLGDFTDDRDALVLTPKGGQIIHTKSYPAEVSSQNLRGQVNLNKEGGIEAELTMVTGGIQFDRTYAIIDMDQREKEEHYKDFFDQVNNIKLNRTNASMDRDKILMHEDVAFTADGYAVQTGEDMLFRLNVFNTYTSTPKRDRNRTLPLEISYGYSDYDEVVINLPDEWNADDLPEKKSLESKFGTYEISVESNGDGQLIYKRNIVIHSGLYPSEDYEPYRKFKKKINQLDQLKIILTKTQKT